MIPSRVYSVFGDCQAAAFEGTVIAHPGHPNAVIVGHARWQPVFRAEDFFPNGRFCEMITRALVENRALRAAKTEQGYPFAVLSMPVERGAYHTHYYAPRAEALDQVMAFSVGEVDAFDLGHEISGNVRIDMPLADDLPGIPEEDQSLPAVSPESVADRIRERCASYFAGLQTLQAAGFTNVFLHALLPPGPTCGEGWPPVIVRLKLHVLFNRIYREFCDASGIGYLSVWDELLRDGLRDRRYDTDGLHANASSAAIRLARLHDAVVTRNPVRDDSLVARLAAALGVDAGELDERTRFEGLSSWDSQREIELAIDLEAAYGVTFADDELLQLRSVPQVRAVLAAHGVAA